MRAPTLGGKTANCRSAPAAQGASPLSIRQSRFVGLLRIGFSKKNGVARIKTSHLLGIISFAAFAARIALALAFPETGGDWNLFYSIFSENIIRHGCFSLSDPLVGKCVLETGGYFPGFPAFIAATWSLFGKSPDLTYILHSLLYGLVLFHLLGVLAKTDMRLKWIVVVGVMLAISPTGIGWFRFLLTEPLSLVTHLWFLAAMIDSIYSRTIRVYSLALSISAAIYVRPDSALLLAPLLSIYFYKTGGPKSTRALATAILVACALAAIWPARNVLLGSAPIAMSASAHPQAQGYFRWVNMWVTSEYDRGPAIYPLFERRYSSIAFEKGLFLTEEEVQQAGLLLSAAAVSDGQPFPKEIDDLFDELATVKRRERTWSGALALVTIRASLLFLHPYSSFGLPMEVKRQRGESLRAVVWRDPVKIAGKMLLFLYRIVLGVIFAYAVFQTAARVFRLGVRDLHWSELIVLSCLTYVLVKLSFLLAVGGLEARYLASSMLWIETSSCIWLAVLGKRRPGDAGASHGATG